MEVYSRGTGQYSKMSSPWSWCDILVGQEGVCWQSIGFVRGCELWRDHSDRQEPDRGCIWMPAPESWTVCAAQLAASEVWETWESDDHTYLSAVWSWHRHSRLSEACWSEPEVGHTTSCRRSPGGTEQVHGQVSCCCPHQDDVRCIQYSAAGKRHCNRDCLHVAEET